MSQRNRLVTAAITLMAALFLAVPTHAAPLSEGRLPFTGALERAWSWVAELVLPGASAPQRQTARWEKEGGAINPDGRIPLPPAPPATLDEGGAINPDGHK